MVGMFWGSSGPAAGNLHSPRCFPYCPEESQSCFFSRKTFAFFLLHAQGVSSFLLECFLICFSDHLGRKHLHTSRGFMHFAKNTTDRRRKTTLWFFSSIQIHPAYYYIYYYHISTATSTVLLLHWKTHCGLECNTNTICFIYIITTSGLPQNQKKTAWFRIQCKHVDYL